MSCSFGRRQHTCSVVNLCCCRAVGCLADETGKKFIYTNKILPESFEECGRTPPTGVSPFTMHEKKKQQYHFSCEAALRRSGCGSHEHAIHTTSSSALAFYVTAAMTDASSFHCRIICEEFMATPRLSVNIGTCMARHNTSTHMETRTRKDM